MLLDSRYISGTSTATTVASIMIDDAGQVRGRVVGIADWDAAEMRAVIEPFLAPAKAPPIVKSSAR